MGDSYSLKERRFIRRASIAIFIQTSPHSVYRKKTGVELQFLEGKQVQLNSER
jgi:hypothetical protein